jgi:hypothetical protein
MFKSITTTKILLSYFLLAFMVFQPVNVSAQKSSKKNYSINTSNKNGKSTIHVKDNGKDFKIEYEGQFKLSDDDKDIISVSNGGFIEITKTSFGNRRRVVIESDRNGNLIRKYYVGRSEKDYNPDGKAWLAEILPEIVRTTTIAAESRVERFYKKGGARVVLSEIAVLDSDYVKARYFRLLLHYNLSTSELTSLVKTAGEEIKSDHYLSSILRENQKAFLANSQTITAYINATKSIQSDHYVTGVLKEVINDSSINDDQMDSLLEISKTVKSDHYMTQILSEVMDNRDLNSQNIAKIIELSKEIQSDHYKTQVLKKVIHKNGLPTGAYNAFIGTLEDVQSDHYVSEVIMELFENKFDSSSSSFNSLLSLIENNISSGHYATNIYKKMGKNSTLSEDQLVSVFNSATKIRSDHYLSQTLMAFSAQVKRSSEKVKSAYITAAKSIRSETYYGRAVKAID